VSSLVVRLSELTWRKFTSGTPCSQLLAAISLRRRPTPCEPYRRQDLVDRFFDCWTLREAYLKARGMGLSLPLDQFSIFISSNQTVEIRFAPGVSDDARRWRFMKSSPSLGHRLAVADGSGLPGGLPIVVRPWPFP
jgi:4'-phosphopantetheinyl transferase superfamily protein